MRDKREVVNEHLEMKRQLQDIRAHIDELDRQISHAGIDEGITLMSKRNALEVKADAVNNRMKRHAFSDYRKRQDDSCYNAQVVSLNPQVYHRHV